MGHALTLRISDWRCTVQLEGGTPESADLTVDLGSLEVVRGDGGVKPLSEADKRKVLTNAAATLGPGPARFTTTTIEGRWRLTGELTLHGVTRPQVVQVGVEEQGDELRLVATATVRQTDHGIRPYSQLMGALQVADVVDVRADLVVPRP